ncbi:23 kDa integral membrane protein-like [Teleopsis dalmanni]|uniref:23 kDa integral membrane protein-like n=1 Tax=Teleopsis dalmanni TaxID=139649 RepID=UPI0018CD9034|nr:23 kDa integral membrane protein-like [Teleopsis dalmanni]
MVYLLALVLISFGIYILCSYDTNEIGSMTAYAYIGIGVATLVIFLLGCLGAIRENVCCTVTFLVFLYVIILAQAAVAFLLIRGENSVASNLANSLDTAWEEELKSPGAMSLYENWFDCCGRASPQDYIVNERLPPATCFKNNDNTKTENLITNGCRIEFENYWIDLLHIFNILAWIMIALEFISSIIACCLCNSIRNDNRRAYF